MDLYDPSSLLMDYDPNMMNLFPTQYTDFSSTPFISLDGSYTQSLGTQTSIAKEGESSLPPSGVTPSGDTFVCFSIPIAFFQDWMETEQTSQGFLFNLVSLNTFPPTKRTNLSRASIIENSVYRCMEYVSKNAKMGLKAHKKSCPCTLICRRYLNHPDVISICYITNHSHETLPNTNIENNVHFIDNVVDRAIQTMLSSGLSKLLAKRVTPFLDYAYTKLPDKYAHNRSLTPNHKSVSAKCYSIKSTELIPSDVKHVHGPASDEVIGTRDLLGIKAVQSGIISYYDTLDALSSTTKAWWASSCNVANATDNDISFIPEHPINQYIQPLLKAINNRKSLVFSENDNINVHPSLAERSIHTYMNPHSSMLDNLPDVDQPNYSEALTIYLTLIRSSFPTLLGQTVKNEMENMAATIYHDIENMHPVDVENQIGPLNFKPHFKNQKSS